MAPTLIENESKATSFVIDSVGWFVIERSRESAYRCHICLIPEEDGTWSATVLNLPGAGSCGKSEEEALLNVREAIIGVIASYVEDGEKIPWCDASPSDAPDGAKQRWILVNA